MPRKRKLKEIVMKHRYSGSILRVLMASTVVGLGSYAQAHECSLSSVSGKYGHTSTGTIVTPAIGPFTAVGHTTWTDTGTMSGAQTTSVAGNLVDETLQGTYAVNADCTGTATVYVYHGTTVARVSHLYLVWDDHQQEVRAIFQSPGTNISIQARRISDE
jgi:uncharacterized protein YcfJ